MRNTCCSQRVALLLLVGVSPSLLIHGREDRHTWYSHRQSHFPLLIERKGFHYHHYYYQQSPISFLTVFLLVVRV